MPHHLSSYQSKISPKRHKIHRRQNRVDFRRRLTSENYSNKIMITEKRIDDEPNPNAHYASLQSNLGAYLSKPEPHH